MKKRIIGALLALCMMIGLVPSFGALALDDDAKPQLVVSTETAKPGDEVTVSISTVNNPGFAVITMPIDYDKDRLEYIGFENAGLTSWTVVKNAVWVGDEDTYLNGVILKLKFKVLDSAEAGLAEVSVDCRPGDVYKWSEEPVMFETVSGGVEVQHVHDYTAAVTEPTCTEKGYTTYTCNCGDSYVDDYVDALGHDFGEWTVIKAATCTEAGEEARACSRCDVKETREISALGHKWDDGVVTTEPTEEATGVKTYTCTVCGETKTETIPVLGHTHNYAAVVTEPTCTEKGYTTYTCRCGDSYVDDYVDALGHDFGEWTVTKAATCTEAGERTRTCSRCDTVETEAIPALGHDFGEWTVTKAATCTEAGERTRTCSRCDAVETEAILALGHDFGEWTVTKPATCTEAGVETRTCTHDGCEAVETREISAIGHKWDDGVVTTEPTATKDGIKTFTCTLCGETKTEVIPATGVCDGGEACPGHGFSDMPAAGNWAHAGIDYCITHNLMYGMSDSVFDPDGATTRAQLVTILWRQAGSPEATKDSAFVDLTQNWYKAAVAWAAENNIVAGRDAAHFDPDAAISREEMAAILYRYAQNWLKLDMSKTADITTFPDYSAVSSYARPAMAWANAEEILHGTAQQDGVYLDPQGNATRAQIALILMNFCENVAK